MPGAVDGQSREQLLANQQRQQLRLAQGSSQTMIRQPSSHSHNQAQTGGHQQTLHYSANQQKSSSKLQMNQG